MAPPQHAEQLLIRDYLSRLSTAARGQLSAADRRALLNRTQEFIEQRTTSSGRPHPMDVAKLLTRLGDPSGLVRMERQRLAAERGEDSGESEHQVRGMVARVLRREGGRALGASWHWPAREGQAGLRLTLLDGGLADDADVDDPAGGHVAGEPHADAAATGTARARWPHGQSVVPGRHHDRGESQARHDAPGSAGSGPVVSGSTGSAGTVSNGAASNGTAPGGTAGDAAGHDDDTDPYRTSAYDSAANDSAAYDSAANDSAAYDSAGHGGPGHGGAVGERGPLDDSGEPASAGWLLNEIAGPAELLEPVDPASRSEGAELFDRLVGTTLDFARNLPGRWRRHPVEMTALLLLGPGGFLYPPLWLIGALIALASKLWHPLDKWAGLATPIVLTVTGFVLGVILAGTTHLGHDLHDGWAFAVTVSRFSALASAGYLAWQARRGRRPAPLPPWKRMR